MRVPFLTALLLFATSHALGQVTTDTHALDSLHAATAPKAAAPHPVPKKPTHARARSVARAAVAKAPPQVPVAAPANPVIAPPPLVLPTHPPPPPPPIPVKPNAPGVSTTIPDGIRVTFGPGISDLNPATLAAIRVVAAEALANPALLIGVTAWAPGTADDPSTPRRLSLDRALAARAVLINAGMASDRIRAIAKGMSDIAGGPPDRADIVRIVPPAANH